MEFQWLGRAAYIPVWQQLQQQAAAIADGNASEIIYACEHEPVYSTGRRGIDTRLGSDLPAPVVQSDRGGEMTFHGPGQLMLYPVINLRQRKVGVKRYVHLLEQSCIELLEQFDLAARRRCGFPGVWIEDKKIAALGVRVSRGIAYHGMALNIDLQPGWFEAIHACGLRTGIVNLASFITPPDLPIIAKQWQSIFQKQLMMKS